MVADGIIPLRRHSEVWECRKMLKGAINCGQVSKQRKKEVSISAFLSSPSTVMWFGRAPAPGSQSRVQKAELGMERQ